MKLSQPLRRHPFITLAILVIGGAALAIGHFLATFDLNDYRVHLEEEFSRQLRTPVQLGTARVELRETGIAFRFSELHVGTAAAPLELRADTLWLQLAWRGLLLRRAILSEVALEHPQLRLAPLPAPTTPPADAATTDSFTLEQLADVRIRRIEIQRGELDLRWSGRTGEERTLQLQGVTADLNHLGLGRTVTFDITGLLADPDTPVPLTLSGSVALPAAGSWSDVLWDCALQAKGLDAGRLARLLPAEMQADATGRADLALFVKGRPADATTVQLDLTGQGLRIRPGAAFPQAIPLRHLLAGGTWQHSGAEHRFRQLAVQLDDLRLAGELTVTGPLPDATVTGRLGNSTLPLDTLGRWLPPDLRSSHPLLARLQPGGVLSLESATWHGSLPGTRPVGTVSLDALTGDLAGLAWRIDDTRQAELQSLHLHLANGQWQVGGGRGTVAGWPLTFSGTITPRGTAPLQFVLNAASEATAEQLTALWPAALPSPLAVTGPLPIQVQLAGTTEQATLVARADLGRLDLRYGEELHLPATAGAALTVHAAGTLHNLAIEQASLTYPPLTGTLAGSLDWSEALQVHLRGSIEVPELADLQPLVPLLAKLQPRGAATLGLTWEGPVAAARPDYSLTLRDVAVPTHGVVADISGLSGRLQLDSQGLHSDALTARLGSSPVTLRARVASLAAPRLELDVQAAAVRADELVFPSDQAMLRDLHGRLVFSRDGLEFAPVRVRLDGGTRATVSGSVRNFAAPQVDLAILGEYANVKEIIGLWTDLSPAADAARTARHARDSAAHPLPPIHITVAAAKGDLYGMQFTDARALIVPTATQLLIHPLDFKVGDGYCTTQVRVDFDPAATTLRVSGHAQDVDAYAVHNQLLDRKSILRGTLRGDFYLQGELGRHGFLPTSYGRVRATVRDGVMRHSPVLSTIFSVLNVSQLFQFKLPDINLEGLPFSLLTTELAIDRGKISTEQLVIDSEAISMSYAGSYDMVKNRLDLLVVAKPLGTIDKVVTRLPIAGWILGGEEKALVTAQFKVTGPADQPDIEAIPISAISRGVLGIFQRTLGLPLKLIEDPAILWGGGGEKKN